MADENAPDPDAKALRPKVTRKQMMLSVLAGVVCGGVIAAASLFSSPPRTEPAVSDTHEGVEDALESLDRALAVDAGSGMEAPPTAPSEPAVAEEPPADEEPAPP